MSERDSHISTNHEDPNEEVVSEDEWRAESGELDEERSPMDVSLEDQVMIFVQLVDRDLQPLPGVTVEIRGDGMPEPRSVTSDERGELLIEDCGPGAYVLWAAGKQVPIHTLSQADLDADSAAYRVLI
ncbi:MAG: hypothetical protein JNJ46_03595 [Myxococcales bacterium]|nr:hypothetical protein [Myxococcales bacterium]